MGQAEIGDRRDDGLVVNKGANDLGGFLRSRRERLTPDAAGIEPCATRRRVPGLRREELAELAGVSIGYYTRLEQGVSGSASGAVIDALAAALQLSPAEHEHLRILAAPRRPTRPRARRSKLRPSVRELLAAMPGTPAIVIDHRADVLAWNRLGHAPPVMRRRCLAWFDIPALRRRPRPLWPAPRHSGTPGASVCTGSVRQLQVDDRESSIYG
ncbi:helix-turn-helix domain-containing protein [Microbispora bryophytorum]|uniref:helix-turn-helix domain-containing protein n=1 Tax=Microbispora bryophytorum TaxID=1460882 RepID=UPI003403DC29